MRNFRTIDYLNHDNEKSFSLSSTVFPFDHIIEADDMKKRFTVGLVVWMFIVIITSLIPNQGYISREWIAIFSWDKIVHLCFYFIMCMLVYLSMVYDDLWSKQRDHALIISVIFAIFSGIIVEILQLNLNTGRYFDIFDILANAIGAILAALIIRLKTK